MEEELQKKSQTITKEWFSGLLKKLHNRVTAGNTSSKNLVAGFKKCGLNPTAVIDRLPKYKEADENISESVSMAVKEMVQDLRNGFAPQTKARRRKIEVQTRKSISLEDLLRSESNAIKEDSAEPNAKDGDDDNTPKHNEPVDDISDFDEIGINPDEFSSDVDDDQDKVLKSAGKKGTKSTKRKPAIKNRPKKGNVNKRGKKQKSTNIKSSNTSDKKKNSKSKDNRSNNDD